MTNRMPYVYDIWMDKEDKPLVVRVVLSLSCRFGKEIYPLRKRLWVDHSGTRQIIRGWVYQMRQISTRGR